MTFYFAWVDPDTPHSEAVLREDEQVISFTVSHYEGDFASLAIEIKNPRRSMLSGSVWAWLSDDDNGPLFYGRLVAVPEAVSEELVRMNFIARPQDFNSKKEAVADALRVFPYYDPVWLQLDRLQDPDVVLEARAELWHIDRLTHDVTTSSITSGEDGIFHFNESNTLYEGLDITYGTAPLTRVRIDATVTWDQKARGTVDFTRELVRAFEDGGSSRSSGLIASYTGQGLADDWPEPGTTLNGGWSVGATSLKRVDGNGVPQSFLDVSIRPPPPGDEKDGSKASAVIQPPYLARFFLWELRPYFPLDYDVSRQRIERVTFDLVSDVQPIVTEPEDGAFELVTLSSRHVSELLDSDTDTNQIGVTNAPIGDTRRSSYLRTDRGRKSIEYLIMVARAKLIARARAVDITFSSTFNNIVPLTLRHSASITDSRIPGGVAAGKIKAYSFSASGDGSLTGFVTIGCTIGNGQSIPEPPPAEFVYGEPDYTTEYQFSETSTFIPAPGDVSYLDLAAVAIADDGVDFFNLMPSKLINSFTVENGYEDQAGVVGKVWPDIAAAVEALNAAHTRVCLDLKPLDGGPFETNYTVTVSDLMLPKTMTL